MIDEAVQLGLAKCFQFKGNIVPELGQHLDAGVGDELRGVEGAPEQAPAIAAELRYQQRGKGVLPVDRGQDREAVEQRLHPRDRQLHLGEVDPAVEARGEIAAVLGAAEALDALAEDEEELVDAAQGVGRVAVYANAKAAQAIERARRRSRQVEEDAAILGPEREGGDVEVALAGADDRVAQPAFEVQAPGVVEQEILVAAEVGIPEAIAGIGEKGQAFAVEHLPVGGAVELQLAGLERAGIGQRQRLVHAQPVVGGDAGQVLERATRVGAAVVDPVEHVDRLLRDLDHQDRRAHLGRMRLEAVLEFQAGQVAGEQEVALDGADVHRPLGGDPRRVVGKEIEIAAQLRRPFDRLDIALEHLDANHGAVGIELLHWDDRAREHVAVRAVLGGDAPGDIVDRLQRDLVPDEIGVELGELRAGVDGRALDADLTHHQHGFGRARRCLDARDGDGGAARLRQRNRRPLEPLALAAGLVAGRDDLGARWNALCDGSERYADHRQSRRDGAHAGEHPRPLEQRIFL